MQKNFLILSCFSEKNCCCILSSAKTERKMKKCFHPTKNRYYLKSITEIFFGLIFLIIKTLFIKPFSTQWATHLFHLCLALPKTASTGSIPPLLGITQNSKHRDRDFNMGIFMKSGYHLLLNSIPFIISYSVFSFSSITSSE